MDYDIDKIKNRIKKISEYSKSRENDPVGNQNCLLCSLSLELFFRGINMMPRAVYSPRDPLFKLRNACFADYARKIRIKNKNEIKHMLEQEENSRYYCHVRWKNSKSGHEFIIANIQSKIYVLDAQAGICASIDSKDADHYFNDIDYNESYILRIDNKDVNKKYIRINSIKPLKWETEDEKYLESSHCDLVK